MNKVEMSTFLQDGEILLKIASRFLHFNSEKGDFIGQMKFNDDIMLDYLLDDRLKSKDRFAAGIDQGHHSELLCMQRPDIFKSNRAID